MQERYRETLEALTRHHKPDSEESELRARLTAAMKVLNRPARKRLNREHPKRPDSD